MLRFFKVVAISEGFSYLFLLVNMLFIKPNNALLYKSLLFPIGMAHGALFIAYLLLAIYAKFKLNWIIKDVALVLIASFIPFGTFYIDQKYLKNI